MGWSGAVVPGSPGTGALHCTRAGRIEYVALDLCEEDHDSYYKGYANGVLWPVFHQRIDLAKFDSNLQTGYQRVNSLFARSLMPLIAPGDLIWIHDYHLIPLAFELRSLGCTNKIGFFLHTSLPPVATLTAIPQHDWLIRSLMACDLIGFQCRDDLRNFESYVELEMGGVAAAGRVQACGREATAGVFPIGIDAADFGQVATSSVAQTMCESTLVEYARRRLLIGVDRLDYSKGLPQRIKAFREFLRVYPEYRHSATLIQIASPSREEVEAYADIQHEMENLCGAINGDYGDLDWIPVRYIHRTMNREQLAGLYRAARVALVTPLRDGMNLVAKEFIAAQDASDPGVLILSRFAGAAERLTQALLVNPHDMEAMAATIRMALDMPLEERRARHAALSETVHSQDIDWWCGRFLQTLRASGCTGLPAAPEVHRTMGILEPQGNWL